jgi:integrase
MRPSEPLKLESEDVDLKDGILTVRQTKFSKSRLILLHPSASRALRKYVQIRDRHVPEPQCGAFFLLDGGRPLRRQAAAWALRYACRRAGLRLTRRKHPRLYDLRHAFVCRRILEWYRQGINVEAAMPLLSTYLGHVKVTDTYWYITAIPELMEVVSDRFERFVCGLSAIGDAHEKAK